MSTFEGPLPLYPHIVIDNFIPSDDWSRPNGCIPSAFIISHIHRDHWKGLSNPDFHENHLKPGKKTASKRLIYLSEVTKHLFVTRYADEIVRARPHFRVVDLFTPFFLECGCSQRRNCCSFSTVSVTFLPAGHCLGSVMVWVEGPKGNCLYTGDTRLEPGHLTRMKPLFDSFGTLKPIRHLHLDTTFYVPSCPVFPRLRDSIDRASSLIREWLEKASTRRVLIKLRYASGFESLLIGIARAFGCKIHINGDAFGAYIGLQSVSKHFTLDGESTRIHACCTHKGDDDDSSSALLGCFSDLNGVLVIVPSALNHFCKEICQPVLIKKSADNNDEDSRTIGLAYSLHASFSELNQMIRFLKPSKVFPNVCPPNSTLDTTQTLLNGALSEVIDDGSAKRKNENVSTPALPTCRKRLKPISPSCDIALSFDM